MKNLIYVVFSLVLLSCSKKVQVQENEVVLVFSKWNNNDATTLYKPGSYEIPFYKDYAAVQIVEDTLMVPFILNADKKTERTIRLNIKPIPEKSFELYDSMGFGYSRSFVLPLVEEQLKELQYFQGTSNELLQKLNAGLEKHPVFHKYVQITKLEIE